MLYIEGAAWISGDMTVGALLSLANHQPANLLRETLDSLRLAGEFTYEISEKASYGIAGTDFNVILPDGYSKSDIKIVPDSTDPVSAPINKGDIVTTATVYYKDEPFTQINLVSNDSVGVSPILYTTDAIRGILTSPWFLIADRKSVV